MKDKAMEPKNKTDKYNQILEILGIDDPDNYVKDEIDKVVGFLDPVKEARDCMNWWAESKKKLKRPRRAYVNWIRNAVKFKRQSPEYLAEREKEYEAEKTKRMVDEAEANKATPESARKKLDDIRRQLKDKISFN